MANQLTSNAEALRLFFTDDVYLVKNEEQPAFVEPVIDSVVLPIQEDGIASAAPTKNEIDLPLLPPMVEEPKSTYQREWSFEFLGKNQKGILILVNDSENKVSSPKGTELLRKLVKAIELTNNDFALVNYANYEGATFDELKKVFSCQLLLSFGVGAKQLAIQEHSLHQLFEHAQTRLIYSSNLHELDDDQASKKMLWSTLQKIK